MPTPQIDERKIIDIRQLRSAGYGQRHIAETLGVAQSTVSKYTAAPYPIAPPQKVRLTLELPDGIVLIGSDAHYWPGDPTTAHRGFVYMCHLLRPDIVILNGDIIDGSRISRFTPIGWEKRPKLVDEVQVAQERLEEILDASQRARHIWTIGNHDLRYETKLAQVAPEYEHIFGMHLKDHFGGWTPAWSCLINNNTMVKHRYRGGDNATFSNVLRAGLSIVTGHLHSLRVTPFSDYRGIRFGVDSGTLAEPYGEQFVDYTEDNPVNWRSGFVALTYHAGQLLWPEVCYVLAPGEIIFRGEVFQV